MFRNRSVAISNDIKASFSPLIQIFPWFGIFPLKIRRSKFGIFLEWSPWFSLYGYICGAFLIIVTLYGGIKDSVEKIVNLNGSLNIVNKIVGMLPMFGFCTSSFFGVFYLGSKITQLLNYFETINEVDSIIKTKYNKFDKYKSLFVPLTIFINTEILLYLNFLIFEALVGSKWEAAKLLFFKHIAYKILTHISLVMQYLIRIMTYNLGLRFSRLNEILQEEHSAIIKNSRVVVQFEYGNARLRNTVVEDLGAPKPTEGLLMYNKAYLKLMEAVGIINDLSGINILLIMVATFISFLYTSYFILLILGGKPQGHFELLTIFMVFSYNILRVVIITEPFYDCMGKIKDTGTKISNLLSLKVGRDYRRQLKTFAECVYLTDTEFTACGLITVNRLLIAEFIGAVSNYVSIFLGFKQQFD